MATDKITFKCAKCGSAVFDYPNNPKPNDMVTCKRCGATGRYADVQAQARKKGLGVVKKMINDAVKKFGK